MMRLAMMLAAALAVGMTMPAAAQTEVKMINFSGSTNVVSWIAMEKGFFMREGLKVTEDITPGSRQQMLDFMAGKYQFASVTLDNVIAYAEGQGDDKFPDFDVVSIIGVHSGMNSLVARPEIKKLSDLKGKVAAVDSATAGYATILFQILKEKAGLEKDKDYTNLVVGSSTARIKALKEGSAQVAMISSPTDMRLREEGYTFLGDAATEIGDYQASTYAVRKSYAKAHENEVLAFIRAMVTATDYVFSDKAGTIDVLKKRIKDLSDAEASQLYDRLTGRGGLNKRSALNTKGVETVLKLRTLYGGAAPASASKYIDLCYYEKALKN
jgi:ABC-type nitrate/sulfonate/bicarbonate transport system substrate-binding protein